MTFTQMSTYELAGGAICTYINTRPHLIPHQLLNQYNYSQFVISSSCAHPFTRDTTKQSAV